MLYHEQCGIFNYNEYLTMKNHKITLRDLVFAAINGAIFGLGFTVIANNSLPFFPMLPFIITTLAFSILAVIGVAIGSFLSRWKSFFFQLSKFGIVGTANTAVDLGVFNLLIILVGGTASVFMITILKGISFFAAVINSYIWNRYWSFDKTDQASANEFIKFITVSLIGLGINAGFTAGISAALSSGGGITSTAATIAAAIASLIVLAWNFIGYKLFVFKK